MGVRGVELASGLMSRGDSRAGALFITYLFTTMYYNLVNKNSNAKKVYDE